MDFSSPADFIRNDSDFRVLRQPFSRSFVIIEIQITDVVNVFERKDFNVDFEKQDAKVGLRLHR